MSLYIVLLIMAFTGILGGIVNYLLPANEEPETRRKIRNIGHCIILGIGATVLVPLFLEIAQSRLLNEIKLKHDSKNEQMVVSSSGSAEKQPADSSNADTLSKPKNRQTRTSDSKDEKQPLNPLKDYLLYAGYCFLAAAAGLRFINNLMDGVLKDKQIASLKDQKEKEKKAREKTEEELLKEEKERKEAEAREAEAKQEKLKLSMQNKVNLMEAEQKVQEEIQPKVLSRSYADKPVIRDITVPDDPQKGRFGGQREVNNRKLSATVIKSIIPMFYDVVIWVEPSNDDQLKGEVVFYLHDSFYQPVRVIKEEEFISNKAMIEVKAYGAFTVGAVCDEGNTLLEYDLSEDSNFPQEFRDR